MVAPRLEVDLGKIHHNAHTLVSRLADRAISVTGVTKATLGSVEVANTLLRAGVSGLGDSRIKNIKAMRLAGKEALGKSELSNDVVMMLIRSPMLSEIKQVVRFADISCNTEIEVIKELSLEAQKQDCVHHIILMVELGDLREGIMPEHLPAIVKEVLGLPNIFLKGLGTNLACRNGVSPADSNMQVLSELANQIETSFNLTLDIVSGGNSANLEWALSGSKANTGRVNNLRIGEAILLGCETLHRQPLNGLHTNAFSLVAEVIESKHKPSQPWGDIAQSAFGVVEPVNDRGPVRQAILAIGIQDTDPEGLYPPSGIKIAAASSDHLIIESDKVELVVGQEVVFQLNYSALLRAMTSPYISETYVNEI